MSDNGQNVPGESFGELLGKNIAGLLLLSIWQTRALMALTSAIGRDSAVSHETREAAKDAAAVVEKMVDEIEKLSNGAVKLGKAADGEQR